MADASSATRSAAAAATPQRRAPGLNGHSIWAMYRFQMVRFFRTIGESLATPVITTARSENCLRRIVSDTTLA